VAAALSFVVYWLSLECYDDQAQVPAIFQKLSSTCDFLEDDCSFSSIYSRRYNVNVKAVPLMVADWEKRTTRHRHRHASHL